MPAHTPEETHLEWTKAFHAGDLDGLVAMYEPGATVVQVLTCGFSEPYAAATSRSSIHAGR